MKAEIISIGTELLLGHIVNTNASFLSRKLAELGIDVYYHTTVGDNPERLVQSLRRGLRRSDIVITTGGLGPTVDDITIETIAKLLGHRHVKWIPNKTGTAPGLTANFRNSMIVCLPGPPRELEPMFEKDVSPIIRRRSGSSWIIKSRTVKLTGLAESKINLKVRDLLSLKPPTTVGIYAKLGEVDLKIMAKARSERDALQAIRRIERKIMARLKGYVFGHDEETLEETVAKILIKKKKTIAIAESCTGGLVSNRLTDVSGSSKFLMAAIVTYSNKSKEGILGVSKQTLHKYGAVSKQVALGMARGVKHLIHTDMGLAITGIAGPTGGTKSKPVGLVYIAIVTNKKQLVEEFHLRGSRREIKFQASQKALDLIRNNL